MKKHLFILASVSLFSIGLAMYANNSSMIKNLSESNVEALSSGTEDENSGNDGIDSYGEYPHRVIINSNTNVVILEGYKRIKEDGEYINDCEAEDGKTCTLNTSTTLSDAEGYAAILSSLLPGSMNLISWILSLFN